MKRAFESKTSSGHTASSPNHHGDQAKKASDQSAQQGSRIGDSSSTAAKSLIEHCRSARSSNGSSEFRKPGTAGAALLVLLLLLVMVGQG
jgi:hypothetical protein